MKDNQSLLEKIVAGSLKQKGLMIFISLLIVGFGVLAYYKLPIDAFPDVTNIQVEIVSRANGLSAEEIERSVTQPVEMAMKGLPKILETRSVTKFGLSIVTIKFEDNVDIYFARQLVFERLAEAKEKVPKNVEIEMGPIATVMGEIYQYTLQGTMPKDSAQKIDYLANLRTLEEWVITPLLKNIQGVNEINSFGGYFKQYQVVVAPEKLINHNISIEEVFNAIDKNNQNAGGNFIERYSEQYIVRGVGLIKNTDDLANIVLKSNQGTPVYLKDVADVHVGSAVRQGAALLNGEEAVGGIVMMLRGENSQEVVEKVKTKVNEINESSLLPDGIKLVPYYDRTDIVNGSISTVLRALLEGGILVLIALYLFLRSYRGAFVVLLSLLTSFLLTFILMKLTGLSANIMTFGGLAISIGMVIDATIIQVENVQRHLSELGASDRKFNTVLRAVIEVRKPSLLGELIIALTFIPILSLQGIEGKMFAPLALTVAITLLSSLLLSIFVIPVFSGIFLKSQPEKESFIMPFLYKIYRPALDFSLRNKNYLVISSLVLLIAAIMIIPRLGTEFLPIMDEGSFDMDISLLPGISLDRALEINKLTAKKLMKFPELDAAVARIGQTGVALDSRGVDKTGYVGILRPKSEWKTKKTREELNAEMRAELETIPGIAFGFSQPIQCRIDEIVAGTRAQLIIKLFGEDLDKLTASAEKISKVVSKIDGATDVMTEKVSGQPYLTVNIDRNKIARYGLNIADVQEIIEIAIAGKPASKLYEQNRSFDITVRLPEDKRNSVAAIGSILVPTKNIANIPLSQLADIAITEGPAQISRENGMRRIGIELNVASRDIGSFVAEAKEKIKEEIKLPNGYYIEWGGQFESQERAMRRIMIILPISIAVIFLLLFLTFKSIRLAGLVMTNLPFALIGGVFSLFISGLYLSVPASIGFIVLFGVAVLNGLVLVSHISQLREDGLELQDALKTGCANRLRPVIMTASISIFSLIPMIFSTGTGSEIQKPLAVVVIGGLFSSTLLTLLIIPSMYGWFEKKIKKPALDHE